MFIWAYSVRHLANSSVISQFHYKKAHDWGRGLVGLCRGGQIRTDGLLLPKQARYRATLHPEKSANIHGKEA